VTAALFVRDAMAQARVLVVDILRQQASAPLWLPVLHNTAAIWPAVLLDARATAEGVGLPTAAGALLSPPSRGRPT
jgi:hypothetical protein